VREPTTAGSQYLGPSRIVLVAHHHHDRQLVQRAIAVGDDRELYLVVETDDQTQGQGRKRPHGGGRPHRHEYPMRVRPESTFETGGLEGGSQRCRRFRDGL